MATCRSNENNSMCSILGFSYIQNKSIPTHSVLQTTIENQNSFLTGKPWALNLMLKPLEQDMNMTSE